MPPPLPRRGPPTLAGRLLLWHALAVVGVLSLLGIVLARMLEGYFVDQLTDSLISEARAVRQGLPGDGPLQSDVVALGRAMDVRITVIRRDGVVLADSNRDPTTMENHRDRPEVRHALQGRVGVTSRRSATTGTSFRYVALPAAGGRIVRVALPLTTVESKIRTVRLVLLVGFVLAAVAGLLAVTVIAQTVARPLRRMADAVARVAQGDLSAEVPEGGTDELRILGHTANVMRTEVASRMRAVEDARHIREAILSALEEGVMLVDVGDVVRYQNPSAVRLLSGPVRTIRQITPSSLAELVSSARADGREHVVEAIVGSATRTVRAAAVPIPASDSVVVVLRDVTETRRVEAMRRDFVANASHELKTPVASIQALAETIAEAAADDPDAVRRFAGQLQTESRRLARVTSDLLDLSRLEGESVDAKQTLLNELVRDEVRTYRDRAQAAGLSFVLSADGPLPVRGSPRELGLLLRNLLDNAFQYTPAGGEVEVRVFADEGEAVLAVRDTGIGIPSRDTDRVFERFYRVDRARSRATGGTGLGLSIVKHVAENHGGSVSVESELGRGSTFTVRLPLVASDDGGVDETR